MTHRLESEDIAGPLYSDVTETLRQNSEAIDAGRNLLGKKSENSEDRGASSRRSLQGGVNATSYAIPDKVRRRLHPHRRTYSCDTIGDEDKRVDMMRDLSSPASKQHINILKGEICALKHQLRAKKNELQDVFDHPTLVPEHATSAPATERRQRLSLVKEGESPSSPPQSRSPPRVRSRSPPSRRISSDPTLLEVLLLGVCLVSVGILCATSVPLLVRSAALNVGNFLQASGRMAAAESLYRVAVWFGPDRKGQLQLADALRAQGRNTEAIPLLHSLIESDGSMPFKQAHVRLGLCYLTLPLANGTISQEHLAAAVEQFEKALLMDAEMPDAHLYLGIAHARGGKTQQATAHLERALQLDEDNTEAHWQLAVLLHSQQQLQEALNHYQTVLAGGPSATRRLAHSQVHFRVALCILELHQVAGAHSAAAPRPDSLDEDLERGVAMSKESEEGGQCGAESTQSGGSEQAWGDDIYRDNVYSAVEANQADIGIQEGMVNSAQTGGAAGREAQVLHHLREAVRLDSSFTAARMQLGAFLNHIRRWDEAVAEASTLVHQFPYDHNVHWMLAIALQGVGRCEEALEHYKVVLDAEKDHVQAHFRMAICLQEVRQPSDAIVHYQEVLRVDPDYAPAHVNWGIALKVMGKRKGAVSHYQMALDLDPESIDARVRWSNVLMEQWAEQRTRPGAQQLFSDALALVQSGLEIDRLYPGLAARHAAMLRIKEAHDKEHLETPAAEEAKPRAATRKKTVTTGGKLALGKRKNWSQL
mmetsp:Transcript_6411/g.12065  ORF Transcript_6411/g.12065 Transcript_6411/m.12065 type:complete len:763 (+) Transcript_6411:375-2663(+)